MIMYFFQRYLHLSVQEASDLYYMIISNDEIFQFLKSHEVYLSFNDCKHLQELIDNIGKLTCPKDRIEDYE